MNLFVGHPVGKDTKNVFTISLFYTNVLFIIILQCIDINGHTLLLFQWSVGFILSFIFNNNDNVSCTVFRNKDFKFYVSRTPNLSELYPS